MRVTIIGSGYVGLVTGACLAEYGNDVLCLDLDPGRIHILQSGGVPIHEPGLAALMARNVAAGRLAFSTDIAASVAHGEIQFIAVGTPPGEDGSADLRHVLAAARNIGRYMDEAKVVVNKSTVPVGTADQVRATLHEALTQRKQTMAFSVVSNPEFLKEGAAVDDFMRPDRIVIGADDEIGREKMRALYAPLVRNHDRILHMDTRSAELTKYAANAMLATRISFMNELANLAEDLGADIEAVRRGIGSDPRIGYHFLYPGIGYGGSCFPKDVRALQHTAACDGRELAILAAVESVNAAQKHVLTSKIIARYGMDLHGRHFALWGLAFKPETDDLREAPSRVVIDDLLARGATVSAYDPVATMAAKQQWQERAGLTFAKSALAALDKADALVIVTEWKAFRSPDFGAMGALLKAPVIFDGRNLYDPAHLADAGFAYYPVGRAQPAPRPLNPEPHYWAALTPS